MGHRNAPLTPQGRLLLCRRVEAGTPIAHVAEAMGISRRCASKWWHRYQELGADGLHDRSSRPRRSPKRTPARLEARIVRHRRRDKVGPDRIAARLDIPASTVHRVLVRHDLNRLSHLDRQTTAPIRRYERTRPGELVHVDVKKLGRIPKGGGHKVHGRRPEARRIRGVGYAYLHTALDDHTRLAYTEVLPDEKGPTAAAFWRRAEAWFQAHGIVIERVLTDNGFCYRGKLFNQALGGIRHLYCRPYRPQTNGKVERFHRTLLEEWAYVRPYTCEAARTRVLATWLHRYNHHRQHTAIGGPPISRVTNLPSEHT
jgi:transposase InsO family protein